MDRRSIVAVKLRLTHLGRKSTNRRIIRITRVLLNKKERPTLGSSIWGPCTGKMTTLGNPEWLVLKASGALFRRGRELWEKKDFSLKGHK